MIYLISFNDEWLDAAEQLKEAYDDFTNKCGTQPVQEFPDCLLYPKHDEEQLRNYDNREIQEGH